MRTLTHAAIIVLATSIGPVMAQQAMPNQSVQDEADKGVKTRNSGASGYVADEQTPGAASHAPGQPNGTTTGVAGAPSAQNSGTGISGMAGNKNGPAAEKGTVGSNTTVQQQDPAKIQGLPGNKNGPPARP